MGFPCLHSIKVLHFGEKEDLGLNRAQDSRKMFRWHFHWFCRALHLAHSTFSWYSKAGRWLKKRGDRKSLCCCNAGGKRDNRAPGVGASSQWSCTECVAGVWTDLERSRSVQTPATHSVHDHWLEAPTPGALLSLLPPALQQHRDFLSPLFLSHRPALEYQEKVLWARCKALQNQ